MLTSPKRGSSTTQIPSLFDEYAAYLTQAGKRVYRSSPEEWNRIQSSLDEARQKRLIDRLEDGISLFQEIRADKEEITNSSQLLWRFLTKRGFTPCSDIFGKLGDTDVVEIYSSDQVHLFQNLNFFDWISVSLERVLSETWYEVTWRDSKIAQDLFAYFQRVVSGELRQTFAPDVPWHSIRELESEMLFQFDIRIKWVSPIFVNGKIVGLISVNECRDLVSLRA